MMGGFSSFMSTSQVKCPPDVKLDMRVRGRPRRLSDALILQDSKTVDAAKRRLRRTQPRGLPNLVAAALAVTHAAGDVSGQHHCSHAPSYRVRTHGCSGESR